MLGEKISAYVAQSATDYLTSTQFSTSSQQNLASRNQELEQRYERVIVDASDVQQQGIRTIEDLRSKYYFLQDLGTARKYFNL